jgi:NAD(P)H dehydrogenase (quinone)
MGASQPITRLNDSEIIVGKNQTLLVTGASGQLGRRVVELLLDAGAGTVVAATRDPAKLADLAARGAVVRRADFDDEASLVEAFQGVDRLLLISTDALDRPGRRLAQHEAAVRAAVRAGVGHIVYTSLTNPGAESPISIAPDHRQTEEAIAATKLGFTILRNNLYIDLQLHTLPRAVATGELVTATGTGGAGYVTREDCARAAAAALASSEAGRVTLDITGPAVVTQSEIATITGEITGRTIAHVAIDAASLKAGMVAAGLPEPVAEIYASFDTGIARGTLAVASTAVRDLTGRAPTSVTEFLRANRAALLAAPR